MCLTRDVISLVGILKPNLNGGLGIRDFHLVKKTVWLGLARRLLLFLNGENTLLANLLKAKYNMLFLWSSRKNVYDQDHLLVVEKYSKLF